MIVGLVNGLCVAFLRDFAVHGDAGHDVDRHRRCAAADQRHSGLRHAEELCRRFRPRPLAGVCPRPSISPRGRGAHLVHAELHHGWAAIFWRSAAIFRRPSSRACRTKTYLVLAYVICSMLASVSGLALTAQIGSGQAVISAQLTLESIAAAVIAGVSLKGGVGRVEMVALARVLLLILTDAMDLLRIDPRIQTIFLGIIVVLAVAVERSRSGGRRLTDASISGARVRRRRRSAEACSAGCWCLRCCCRCSSSSWSLSVYACRAARAVAAQRRQYPDPVELSLLFASAQMVVILTRGFDLSLGIAVSAVSVASALAMTGLATAGAPDLARRRRRARGRTWRRSAGRPVQRLASSPGLAHQSVRRHARQPQHLPTGSRRRSPAEGRCSTFPTSSAACSTTARSFPAFPSR